MDVAVVIPYFNPLQHETRRRNLERCLVSLYRETPRPYVICVELTYGLPPEARMADHHIVLTEGDFLWQKEALGNVGICSAKDAGFEAVMFLDADCVCEDDRWVQKTGKLLDEVSFVQPWEQGVSRFTDRDAHLLPSVFHVLGKIKHQGHPGGCCAFRLREVPSLWPYAVVGGGDHMMWDGFRVKAGKQFPLHHWVFNGGLHGSWKTWYDTLLPLSMGYLPAYIELLPHGSYENRAYQSRVALYEAFQPWHVQMTSERTWCWTPTNSELPLKVQQYLEDRQDNET